MLQRKEAESRLAVYIPRRLHRKVKEIADREGYSLKTAVFNIFNSFVAEYEGEPKGDYSGRRKNTARTAGASR